MIEDISKYPFLFGYDIPFLDPTETWLDAVPDGWKKIFLEFCDKIVEILEKYDMPAAKVSINTIKEKFGELRVYFDFHHLNPMAIREIQDANYNMMEKSRVICYDCGEPAVYQSNGWILPFCEKCAVSYLQKTNENHKTNFTLSQLFDKIN